MNLQVTKPTDNLMQHWPLLCHRIIDHAALIHGRQEVVTQSVEGPIHRTTYAAIRDRALRVAQKLDLDGIAVGDRVATLAWNTWRHLECWYGIMGTGAICHTVNPRLFPEQIAWIINDAADRIVMTDITFVPLLEKLADKMPGVERYIVLTDNAHMPQTSLKNAVAYEDWIADVDGSYRWHVGDENAASAMCYTSGTTGNPKGVVYTHRTNVLHAMMGNTGDAMALTATGTILPVVPMFHANSWGLAFAAPFVGAKMVMPGPKLDGASVYNLLQAEKVTVTAGVPTVWQMLLGYIEANKLALPHLKLVVCGGSAMPRAMIEAFLQLGVTPRQAWGMTETSPMGTMSVLKPPVTDLPDNEKIDFLTAQGYPPFGVELKITDDAGASLPRDGRTYGRLKIRGLAVVRRYYGSDAEILDEDGYFDTGDVATIDPHGYMRITDRAKDVIKSGGEWISSIELENLAVSHPAVMEAAVIGLPHPKWNERPLLVIQLKSGMTVTAEQVLDFMEGKIAKWWMPSSVVFVDAMPHTATGKIMKTTLRDQFKNFRFPV
ncbi:long-chain-fatty-acid--CoA ligase [Bradyrhizobium sp. Pear76]|uniref:long-chain-fatty-acid--CoA ligase n=1 Tax=Bradyrhizobium oropedii TaxID=1571201 RepID=UPI001E3C21DC|nr:long-chain-fatty-acid--CoA ligase [Bradyrhizobium oropedii]MCC8964314.1 long-chain-fatty-acid--CoA ligase [Bradyrhizobium oropedii]